MPPESRKLLLIEDDPFLIEWVEQLVGENIPGTEVITVQSEREFLIRKEWLSRQGFRGIILDVMLPWEDGEDADCTLFPDPRGTYFDAGTRIMDDLAQIPAFAAVPVLIHTVNDRSAVEIPRGNKLQISFLRKDEPDHKLIHWINRLLP